MWQYLTDMDKLGDVDRPKMLDYMSTGAEKDFSAAMLAIWFLNPSWWTPGEIKLKTGDQCKLKFNY